MTKNLNVYAVSGGGIRGGSTFGAQLSGKNQNKWHPDSFDIITGDSFGGFDAALTCNGWTPEDKIEFFLETDFSKLISPIPWNIRQTFVLVKPLSLEKISKAIDNLNLKPDERLFINSWDMDQGRQIIYCEKKPDWLELNDTTIIVDKAFSTLGYGTIISRSMALPGLVSDDFKYVDGGISEHPPLSFIPKNSNLLLITLGYAGLVRPFQKSFIERAFYSYEVKSKLYMEKCLKDFKNCQIINPKIYDISSTQFNLNKDQKFNMIQRAIDNTVDQWKKYELPINI